MTDSIQLPAEFKFKTTLTVRIDDINYGQHLGHDSLVSLLHEARLQFLYHHRLSEKNIYGASWVMASLSVEYKNQAFYGDNLSIQLTYHPISRTGIEFIHLVTNEKSKKEIARAKAVLIFFDYESQKVRKIPDEFKLL